MESNEKMSIKSGFKGTYAYCAPEIVFDQKYSQYGDIYAYGMIVFEILTNDVPFEGRKNIYQLMKMLMNDYRPEFKYPIPYCYRKLIEKCWSYYTNRPSFETIINDLETNKKLLS